jgi:hypothetical protein
MPSEHGRVLRTGRVVARAGLPSPGGARTAGPTRRRHRCARRADGRDGALGVCLGTVGTLVARALSGEALQWYGVFESLYLIDCVCYVCEPLPGRARAGAWFCYVW